jgi:DNA modification methylase
MTAPYYADEFVTLYHGDCLEITEWTAADVLVTDPPYGMAYAGDWNHSRAKAGLKMAVLNDHDTSARDAALDAWHGKPAVVFGRWSMPHPAGTRVCLTWDKGDWPGMGDLALPWGPSTEEIYVLGSGFVGKRSGSIVRHTERPNGVALHPSQKPLGLLENLLAKCPPGVIADPFAGSGSTLVAAKAMGRRSIGVELEERYCEIAAKRLAQSVLDFEGAS